MKTWTEKEISILTTNYNSVTNQVLSEMLPGKTKQAIYKKAYKLGLRKSKEMEFLNRSEAKSREKSSNWHGGVRTTKKGYRQVLIPNHPRADTSGYVMEHIVVWEKATGFSVPDGCCIHHLNGKKSDNRIENLCLMSFGAHTVLHHTGKQLSKETKDKIRESRAKTC